MYTMRRKGTYDYAKAVYLSDEIRTYNKMVMGPKLGVYTSNGLAVGANFIYYTDFTNAAPKLRPEIGIAVEGWKLMYGYNIPLNNTTIQGVNTHVVSLMVQWRIANMKEKKVERDWNPSGRLKYMVNKYMDSTTSRDKTVLMAGVNGFTNTFAELGIGLCSQESYSGKKGQTIMGYLSIECLLTGKTIIGPKIGMMVGSKGNFGICGGLSLIDYIGMNNNSLVTRPELGVHFGACRLVYGYNHSFTRYSFSEVNQHNISAIFGIKVHKTRITVKGRNSNKSF